MPNPNRQEMSDETDLQMDTREFCVLHPISSQHTSRGRSMWAGPIAPAMCATAVSHVTTRSMSASRAFVSCQSFILTSTNRRSSQPSSRSTPCRCVGPSVKLYKVAPGRASFLKCL